MKILYSGWLPADAGLPWTINGIAIDPATKTRNVEYNWASNYATGSLLLDAATGYVPTWHMLPEILVNVPVPRTVIACDMDERQSQMPPHSAIVRMYADITSLPFLNVQFDTVFCISTLEHLEQMQVARAVAELVRVAKSRIVLTADAAYWLPGVFGLPLAESPPEQGMLNPPVYALAIDLE